MNVGKPETLRALRQNQADAFRHLKNAAPDRGKLSARTGSLHPQWRACRQTPSVAASPRDIFVLPTSRRKRSAAELGGRIDSMHQSPIARLAIIQIVPPAMTNKMRPEKDVLEIIHFLPWRSMWRKNRK